MKALRKIGAILLIPVILFSSLGFSVDVHFCKGEAKSINLFGEAEACDMGGIDENLPPCHQKKLKELKSLIENTHHENGDLKSICCYNETFNFEANQEIEEQKLDISSHDFQLVMVACILCDYSFFVDEEHSPSYSNYDPPLIRQDFSVLYQTFLI